MKLALDASAPMVQSEDLRRWLLLEDDVLFRQATITMGMAGLTVLAREYTEEEAYFEAGSYTQSCLTAVTTYRFLLGAYPTQHLQPRQHLRSRFLRLQM
jgi:hypothetical protein